MSTVNRSLPVSSATKNRGDGDGSKGHGEHAAYDRVLIAEQVPAPDDKTKPATMICGMRPIGAFYNRESGHQNRPVACNTTVVAVSFNISEGLIFESVLGTGHRAHKQRESYADSDHGHRTGEHPDEGRLDAAQTT